jgi:hypothetical protein
VWIGFIWRCVGTCCEHGSDLSGSIKGGKFLDGLSMETLLTKCVSV